MRQPCFRLSCLQLIRTRRFQLYDHGSAADNRAAYGQDVPLDVADNYHLLQVRRSCQPSSQPVC
jgi:hypothetical protein